MSAYAKLARRLSLALVLYVSTAGIARSQQAIRVNAGGSGFTNTSTGDIWEGDPAGVGAGFSPNAGQFRVVNAITGAGTLSEVYQTCRYGTGVSQFTFGRTVPNGNYQIRLRFAEPGFPAGGRRFSVLVNSATVEPGLDVAEAAGGPLIALDRGPYNVNVTNGRIDIVFQPISGADPFVNGIEILPGSSSGTFIDLPTPQSNSRMFYNVELMRLIGLTRGCSIAPPRFCTDSTIKRGEMSAFIVRAFYWALNGNPEGFSTATTPYFPHDVPGNHIFFRYVQKMKELGITLGCGPNSSTGLDSFCVEDPLTWGQMAAFTMRAWEVLNYGASTNTFPYPPSPYYSDVQPGHTFYNYIQKLRELQIAIEGGCPGNSSVFCPDAPMKRGETSYFMVQGIMGVPDARQVEAAGPVSVQSVKEHIRMGGNVIATEQTPTAGGVGRSFSLTPGSANVLPGNKIGFSATEPAVNWMSKKRLPTDPDTYYGTFTTGGLHSVATQHQSYPFSYSVEAASSLNVAKTARATVTVMSSAPTVQISNGCQSVVGSGSICPFTATVTPSGGSIVWSVFPEGVGSINAQGVYTAPADLSSSIDVTIRAHHTTGVSAAAALRVNAAGSGGPVQVNPTMQNLGAGAYSNVVFDVAAAPTTTWTIGNTAPWVTILNGLTRTGVGRVEYSVASNAGGPRFTDVQVTGTSTRLYRINQEGVASNNQAPLLQSVAPATGQGSAVSFAARYYDGDGKADIAQAWLIVNTTPSEIGGCVVRYTKASPPFAEQWAVSTDSGYPVNGNYANSQCQLNVAQSGVTFTSDPNSLEVRFSLSFQSGFAGAKNIYLRAADVPGFTTIMQPLGTWTVPGGSAVSVSIIPTDPIWLSDSGSRTLTATTNPAGGVSWSLAGAGTIAPSGNTVRYVAPSIVDYTSNVTITATSTTCPACTMSKVVALGPPQRKRMTKPS